MPNGAVLHWAGPFPAQAGAPRGTLDGIWILEISENVQEVSIKIQMVTTLSWSTEKCKLFRPVLSKTGGPKTAMTYIVL